MAAPPVADPKPHRTDPPAPREDHDDTPDSATPARRTLYDRLEAFVSRLSTKNNFWHRVSALFYLPYAFRSGIRMKKVDNETFTAVLPFKKFNRNWYNAMAGAALLGNAEIAGGMYVFGAAGGEYTVVCRRLEYRFLRPCFGPAMYRILPDEPIEPLIAKGGEFNYKIKMNVVQQLPRADALPKVREKRVGRVLVEFHVTPKQHQMKKGRWNIKQRTDYGSLDDAALRPDPDDTTPTERDRAGG
ncbi:MAG: PaaI family thioesterase [Phycisphaerales bacterium JB037]